MRFSQTKGLTLDLDFYQNHTKCFLSISMNKPLPSLKRCFYQTLKSMLRRQQQVQARTGTKCCPITCSVIRRCFRHPRDLSQKFSLGAKLGPTSKFCKEMAAKLIPSCNIWTQGYETVIIWQREMEFVLYKSFYHFLGCVYLNGEL